MTRRVLTAAALSLAALTRSEAGVPKALGDLKAGRYMEAAAELQAIVDRSPGYAYGYYLLGHCKLKMHLPAEAEEEFRRAVELDSSRPEYFQGLALALKTGAHWERAIQTASEGLARPSPPATQYALLTIRGYALGSVNRWADAARDLEAARKIQSEPRLSLLLGKCYFAQGDYERASAPLRDALETMPDDEDVLSLLAETFLLRAGSEADPARKRVLYADALDYARRLAGTRPADVDVIYLVGRAAMGAGQLLEAEALFLHVLDRQPRQCYAMVNLGRTYLALAKWAESEAFLRKAAACAPRMGVVFETLGDLYMKRGMPQLAVDAYRRAEQIESDEPEARVTPRRPAPPSTPVGNRGQQPN